MNHQIDQEVYCATFDANTRWIDTDLALGGQVGITGAGEDTGEDGWGPLPPEELARLQWQAEHPDLADPLIALLPPRNFSLKGEALFKKRLRLEMRKREEKARAQAAPVTFREQQPLTRWTG